MKPNESSDAELLKVATCPVCRGSVFALVDVSSDAVVLAAPCCGLAWTDDGFLTLDALNTFEDLGIQVCRPALHSDLERFPHALSLLDVEPLGELGELLRFAFTP